MMDGMMLVRGGRSSSASSAERCLLLGALASHMGVLDARENDAQTIIRKSELWDEITRQFNANTSAPRSRQQIQTLYKNMKAKARRYEVRLSEVSSGVPPPDPDPISEMLLGLLHQQLQHQRRHLQHMVTADTHTSMSEDAPKVSRHYENTFLTPEQNRVVTEQLRMVLDGMADIQVFVSKRVVFPDEICEAVIQVKAGKIRHIARHSTDVTTFSPSQVVDCEDLVLMPGVVDSHVHVNEPGRTAWEGFNSATRAAAAGGITTIVDMPLNSIPATTTLEAWRVKLAAAEGQCWVDVGFWGGVVPGNAGELRKMVDHGICGFKCFLVHSGVDEFPSVTFEQVSKALQELVGTQSILLFHAECDVGNTVTDADRLGCYQTFLKSRPQEMEEVAIEQIISLCEQLKVRCHIVHLSASKTLPMIRRAQARGVPLSVETCHHYLSLSDDHIPDNATQFKCCPPIRDTHNRNELWEAIRDGTIQQVVSDHSPCTPDLKQPGKMNFMEAWGGIASLQFGLSLFWTEASARGFTVQDVVRYLCAGPASQARLHHRKGALALGYDADFVVWSPTETYTIDESIIHHKNKITPYMGKTLKGKVYKTVLRGKVIFDHGNFCSSTPTGTFVFASDKLNKSLNV